MAEMFIAIDPGTSKCGMAVMDTDGRVYEKRVVRADDLGPAVVAMLYLRQDAKLIAVGAGTGGSKTAAALRSDLPDMPVVETPEKNTTLIARQIYEREHPRRWPMSMIPFGLFGLPEDMDAYAAVAIGINYIESIREKNK